MNLNAKIKEQIVAILKKEQIKIKADDLEIPPSEEMGDFGLPLFNLSKELKKSPATVAKEIAAKLTVGELIAQVKAVGPYVNFTIDYEKAAQLTIAEILKQKNKYGQSKAGKAQRVMIEFSQPNTHKELHIGHLRNICIGAALVNLYRASGYKVIAANYIGDTGAHVAKTLWYLQNYVNQTDYPAGRRELGEFLGQSYTAAVKKIKENEAYQEQAQELLKKLESGDPELTKLWQQTRQWSLDLFNEVYQELGVEFDVVFYESEEEKQSSKMSALLLKYPFIKKSQGALIADLNEYNLGVLVLLRKDGTALYGIKDLPLAIKKFKKYKISRSIYLIDIRQSQYLKQIFKILQLMGFNKEMIHVPYEFVQLKSGIISSRSGNVITYEEVKEAALNKAIEETQKRHPLWSDIKIKEVSLKIVMAALRFGMLKNSNDKILTFDLESALDTAGFSGPYLQYTVARMNSVLKKAGKQKIKADYKKLQANAEKTLIKDLLAYPEILAAVISSNDPAALSQYLYKLAQDFNAFYHELPVLKAEPEIRSSRLLLLKSINQVINNGMELLGLPVLEEM
ncbi:MAG: arginine--tRNA ligase [Candidatus Parcubacteria bacterium]|nr:arginine--tRNA ligase [Candidatus Parcubacteria bacterium]